MGSKLGQHFLISKKFKQEIINCASKRIKNVLEIGPGRGALTKELLDSGYTVYAVEIDEKLISILKEKFQTEIKDERLIIIEEDIRNKTWENFLNNKNYIVVSNIPYYITNKIIKMLLTVKNQPVEIILLIQKEVAKRITDKKKESLLSLSVKFYSTPKYIMKVPKEAFSPRPKVDSAILKLNQIHQVENKKESHFFETIKTAFTQKRKTMLKKFPPEIQKKMTAKGLDKNTRSEDVPFDIWLSI